MDGLLLDTERIYTEVNDEILTRYGKKFTWDIKAQMMGAKERDAAEIYVKHYKIPLTVDQYIKERREKLQARFPFAKPLPGVKKLVQHLKESGVPIAVATSSHRKMFDVKSSNNQEFFAQFDSITCGDDSHIKNGKPAPDIFLAAAESLGVKAAQSTSNQNCLVFEDSVLGAWAGVHAGMRVILIPDPNLEIEEKLLRSVSKVLHSMEDFVPEEFGLPPYPFP
ncbi:Pseudouridine-5'-phosphatase [Rhizoclosmatium sp. JEL0117]|nr:Pseudouridine-5'-phosphatase [Rhizoclosmatium sp. JEL0117]